MDWKFPYYVIGDAAFLGDEGDEWGEAAPRVQEPLPYVERCTIPARVDGYPVIGVYDINIPPCDVLEFEEGIEEIDLSGVEKSFREVILPRSLKVLGLGCFAETKGLRRAYIPSGLIRPYAFRDCGSLREVVLGDGVTGIRTAAFLRCTALEEVVLPDSVNVLCNPEDAPWAAGSFKGCTALRRAVIGAGVREMWCNPFEGCAALREIVISPQNTFYAMRDGMLIDKRRSMMMCVLPREDGRLTIPQHIMEIGSDALRGCTWLTEVEYLTEHVTRTRRTAFAECLNLRKAAVNGMVGESAFSECTALETVHIRRCEQVQDAAFAFCTSLRTVVIDPGAESLGADVFRGCRALETVHIPASVRMIREDAFASAPNVTMIVPRDSFAHVYAIAMNIPYRLEGTAERITMTEEARKRLLNMELAWLLTQESLQPTQPADDSIPLAALSWAREISLRDMRRLRRGGIEKPADLRGLSVTDMRMRRLPVDACLSLMYLTGLVWNPS